MEWQQLLLLFCFCEGYLDTQKVGQGEYYYGVKGSSWTVWVTGGGILSDLDVYGYTEDTIIFKIERDGYDDCYELSFDQSGALNLAYGTSLDVMDDVIVCH